MNRSRLANRDRKPLTKRTGVGLQMHRSHLTEPPETGVILTNRAENRKSSDKSTGTFDHQPHLEGFPDHSVGYPDTQIRIIGNRSQMTIEQEIGVGLHDNNRPRPEAEVLGRPPEGAVYVRWPL